MISITGNAKTPAEVILKEVPLLPGAVLTEPDLRTAERNLERLGLFRGRPKVTVIEGADSDNFRDILIEVEER
jgi:outer membrane protein assembly factor BamA